MIRLTEDRRRCLDNKEIVALVSMDLSKAFDTILHHLLMAKSRAYGIDDRSCALLLDRQDAACKSRRHLGLDVHKEGRASGQRSWTYDLQPVP